MKNNRINEENKSFFKTIILYTILFVIISSYLLCIFAKYNKEIIWATDGVKQNVIMLQYFRESLVNFIRTGNLSTFTWNVYSGMDLFSNIFFYIGGDIFSYLSILVRTKDIEFLYSFLVILRMYCIGLSFLMFTRYKKVNNVYAVIGALMYTFSTAILFAGTRYPFFMNPAILLPLLLIGIEKIVKEDKKVFYPIIIAVTFIVSYYFAYPLSLMVAIYGLALIIDTYHKEGYKKMFKVLLKVILYTLIGVLIASVVLVPCVYQIMGSSRTDSYNILYYPLSYYRKIVNQLLSGVSIGYWSNISTQSIIFLTVPMFIMRKRKENKPLLILLTVCLMAFVIAPVGSMFMGFKFPNNRWSFAIPFIFSAITVLTLNDIKKIEKKEIIVSVGCVIAFLLIDIIFEINPSKHVILQLVFLMIWMIIIYYQEFIKKLTKKIDIYKLSLIILIVISVSTTINYFFEISGKGYISQYLEKDEYNKYLYTLNDYIPDFANAIGELKDTDPTFYKVNYYPYVYENTALVDHFNSLGGLLSMTPEISIQLSRDTNIINRNLVDYVVEYDYRTRLTGIFGTKYLINYKGHNIPYGYELKKKYKSGTKIYENKYYLPFAMLYTNYTTLEEYNKLSSLEKEVSLYNTAVVEKNTNKISSNNSNNNNNNKVKQIDYEIIDEKEIFKDKNQIEITNSDKNTFKLKIDNIKNSELYIYIEDLNLKPFNKEEMIQLHTNENMSALEKLKVKDNYQWYEYDDSYRITTIYQNVVKTQLIEKNAQSEKDFDDYLINLGYYEESEGEIKVTLSALGNYSFKDIKVYAVSMDNYEEDVNNLRRSNFETTEWNNGYIKGTAEVEESGILQFQTMYNKGFKVYVDGKEVPTLNVNKYFLGIEIDKGRHEIELKYHTPYIKEGIILSIVGLITFTGSIIINRKKEIKKMAN